MTRRFTMVRAVIAATSLCALAAACARKDAARDTANTASTSGSTSGSSGGAMTARQAEDVHDAIRGYRLTEDDVDRVVAATRKMHALEKANPQIVAAMQREHGGASDAKSIDDAAAHLDAIPPVQTILSGVGLSSRDYVLTMFTLMEAGAAYQIEKAGKLPPNSELAKDVSPENLAYVGSHQAQLRALEQASGSGEDGE